MRHGYRKQSNNAFVQKNTPSAAGIIILPIRIFLVMLVSTAYANVHLYASPRKDIDSNHPFGFVPSELASASCVDKIEVLWNLKKEKN